MVLPKPVSNPFIHSSKSKIMLVDNSTTTNVPGITSVTITYSRETQDVTTREDNGFTKKYPGLKSCSVKFDMYRIKGDTTQDTIYEAFDGDDVVLPIQAYDAPGGKAVSGDFVITNIDESQGKNEMVTWSVTAENYGEFERIDVSASSASLD